MAPTDLPDAWVATNLQFEKATVSANHNKVKLNKMRYAYTRI